MRAARVCVRVAMPARCSMIIGFLVHDQWLIGTLLVSLMGNTRMRIHVGNLRGADRSLRGISAIRTISRIRPAVHGLEIFERAAFHAAIFIQRHQYHLTFCNQSKSAAPSLEGCSGTGPVHKMRTSPEAENYPPPAAVEAALAAGPMTPSSKR